MPYLIHSHFPTDSSKTALRPTTLQHGFQGGYHCQILIPFNRFHPFKQVSSIFFAAKFFFLMALNIKLLGYYPSIHELRIAQNVILRKPFRFSSPLPAWQWLPSWARTRPNGLGTARCPPTQPAPTACQRERRSKRRRRPPCCAKMWVY